jgi:hypothetical protein
MARTTSPLQQIPKAKKNTKFARHNRHFASLHKIKHIDNNNHQVTINNPPTSQYEEQNDNKTSHQTNNIEVNILDTIHENIENNTALPTTTTEDIQSSETTATITSKPTSEQHYQPFNINIIIKVPTTGNLPLTTSTTIPKLYQIRLLTPHNGSE